MHRRRSVSLPRCFKTYVGSACDSEDLRVESQRQLLAQGDLEDLERSLQAACHKLRLCEEEVERLQRASAERKQE